MTTDREALIEKAAKAMNAYEREQDRKQGDESQRIFGHRGAFIGEHHPTQEGRAEAALTVFEQANTPTDDEREVATDEALWDFTEYAEGLAEFDRWLAAHDAEVRASVVAEEPEWEYARQLPNGNTFSPAGSDDAGLGEPVRRRKPGPWVPVKQEGESDEA